MYSIVYIDFFFRYIDVMFDFYNRKMYCILWFLNLYKLKKGELFRFWVWDVFVLILDYVFGNVVKDYIVFVYFVWYDLYGWV